MKNTGIKPSLTVHGLWYYKDTMKIRLDNNKYNIGRNFRQYRPENKLTQEETVVKLRYQGIQMSRAAESFLLTLQYVMNSFSCIYFDVYGII